jgi:hypothetical protein
VKNPEYLPSNYDFYFYFGEDEYALKTKTDPVVYEYKKSGTYRLNVEIEALDSGLQIGSLEMFVKVGDSGLSIVLPSQLVKTGQDCTFRAVTNAPLPDAPSYDWDFGDSKGLVIPYTGEAIHVYDKSGTYTVTVKLFASGQAGAPLLGTAVAQVKVEAGEAGFLSYLQKTTHLMVAVAGDTTLHRSDGYTYPYNGLMISVYFNQPGTKWDGTHFTQRYFRAPQQGQSGIEINIDGEVSAEGDKIVYINAVMIGDESNVKIGQRSETKISLVNLPLQPKSPMPTVPNPNYKPQFTAYMEGSGVGSHVTGVFFEQIRPTSSDPNYKLSYEPWKFEDTKRTQYFLVVFKTERIDAYDDPGYQKRN